MLIVFVYIYVSIRECIVDVCFYWWCEWNRKSLDIIRRHCYSSNCICIPLLCSSLFMPPGTWLTNKYICVCIYLNHESLAYHAASCDHYAETMKGEWKWIESFVWFDWMSFLMLLFLLLFGPLPFLCLLLWLSNNNVPNIVPKSINPFHFDYLFDWVVHFIIIIWFVFMLSWMDSRLTFTNS